MTTTIDRPAWALPDKPFVRVTLGDGQIRLGQLLSSRTDGTGLVEYLAPSGNFYCRRLNLSQLEVINGTAV